MNIPNRFLQGRWINSLHGQWSLCKRIIYGKTNLPNSLCSNFVVLTTLCQLFKISLDISSISRSVETRSIPKEFQMTTLMTIHYPWLWGWTENSSPSRSGEQVREAPTSSQGSLCWASWDALSTYFWPSTSTLEASHLSSLQIWFPKSRGPLMKSLLRGRNKITVVHESGSLTVSWICVYSSCHAFSISTGSLKS